MLEVWTLLKTSQRCESGEKQTTFNRAAESCACAKVDSCRAELNRVWLLFGCDALFCQVGMPLLVQSFNTLMSDRPSAHAFLHRRSGNGISRIELDLLLGRLVTPSYRPQRVTNYI